MPAGNKQRWKRKKRGGGGADSGKIGWLALVEGGSSDDVRPYTYRQ